ncbi:hypothetical protein Tcan_03759 [Toxocara canis]|uniref:Uncharacterized protein n=1 Tax=Toxocara canis TaxID=6265 RepID=A0A0B2UR26_TOXCA|nr:hypothetical protein Tcan_03759 [Toxocara canis]
MDDEEMEPPRVKRKFPVDDYDGDDEDIPMTPPHSEEGTSDEKIHERMFMAATTNNLIISQMEDEIRKMRNETAEQIGQIQFLKFKVQNSNKEKAQLQSQLLEIRKIYEQKLNEERSRHEKLEEELRSEITYQLYYIMFIQEQEQRSKEFRERFDSSTAVPTDQQSEAIAVAASAEASQVPTPATVIRTKKVMLSSRHSGAAFPRRLNDSQNLASLFSHRKRAYGESQATFQSIPSPTKDPYQRPDFFYDIKRKTSPENMAAIGTERRWQLQSTATKNVDTQTSTKNVFDVSDSLTDKRVMDAIWALYDPSSEVDFWNIDQLKILKGESRACHIRLRDCAFC